MSHRSDKSYDKKIMIKFQKKSSFFYIIRFYLLNQILFENRNQHKSEQSNLVCFVIISYGYTLFGSQFRH